MVVDRWFMRGDHLYLSYDTKQIFSPHYIAEAQDSGVAGTFAMLPPYYNFGRHMIARNKEFYMRLSSLYFKQLKAAIYFTGGALVSAICAFTFVYATTEEPLPAKIVKVEPVKKLPTFDQLEIISSSAIYKVKAGSVSTVDELIMVTDGTVVMSIDDLKRQGFKHIRYSDCFHELVDNLGNVIPVYCASSYNADI